MEEERKEQEEAVEQEQQEQKSKNKNEEWFEKVNNTEDVTEKMDSKDVEENKVMGVLAYIGILVLIPLLAAPKSKFARYHSNQGLILLIIEVLCSAIFTPLGFIPYVGIVFSIIGGLVGLVCLVLLILGIVNAAQGKAKTLPLIGKFNILKWDVEDTESETKEETKKESNSTEEEKEE